MENGSDIIDEYDFDEKLDSYEQSQDIADIIDQYETVDLEESRINEDLEPEFREGKNRECLQALSYDRAFVVNGPVIKVYKNGDDEEV